MIFISMENIIKTSETKSEAIIKLYGYDNGTTRQKFMFLVKEQNIDISHLKSKKSKYKTQTKNCPVCNKSFETIIGNKEERTTCSYSCSNTYFRSGDKNGNWSEDQYRTTCFLYHEKKCVICGEENIVTVHHYDKNKKNNSPENLIPMCPTHHQFVHSKFSYLVKDKVNEYRNNFIKHRVVA